VSLQGHFSEIPWYFIMRMFFVAGIGVAVFIDFLLISKKNKSASDQILTVWMFLILVHLFLSYIYITEDVFRFPFLLGLEHPLPLFQGVFLYLYVSSLTDQLSGNRKILLLHFVPPLAMYLYLVPFFLLPGDQKIQVYRNHGAGYELFMILRSYAIASSGIFYVIWSALLLRKHRNAIRDQFSDLEKINLRWLQILTFGMGGIWFLVIFFRSEVLILTGIVIFVFLIGFFGVRQAAIFTPGPVPEDADEQKKKYPKSGLTEEASAKLHQALIRLITEEALYKKSDLSINDLSSRLGVHPNYLSQIINQKGKKNFYDFVNTYRLEEFKRLIALQKNQQYTLLALAYDCGFSSKSSFNRYFKKATGQTPSDYSATLVRS
jgi:AraC-like DNA-binding protein